MSPLQICLSALAVTAVLAATGGRSPLRPPLPMIGVVFPEVPLAVSLFTALRARVRGSDPPPRR